MSACVLLPTADNFVRVGQQTGYRFASDRADKDILEFERLVGILLPIMLKIYFRFLVEWEVDQWVHYADHRC